MATLTKEEILRIAHEEGKLYSFNVYRFTWGHKKC